MSAFAKPNPGPPHEIDIARLVEKLIDVRALVGNDCHAQIFVLERNAAMAFKNHLSYPAAVVPIVMKRLIVHLSPRSSGQKISREAHSR